MVSPVVPRLVNVKRQEFECDRVGGDPEEWKALPPEFHTPSEQMRWYGVGDLVWGSTVSVHEAYRFTAERRHLLEAFQPALEVPHVEHMHLLSPAISWIGDRYVAFLRVSNYPVSSFSSSSSASAADCLSYSFKSAT